MKHNSVAFALQSDLCARLKVERFPQFGWDDHLAFG